MKSTLKSRALVCSFVFIILVCLSARKVQANSAMNASPSSLSFGSLPVNSLSSPEAFTILNTGSQKITIESVASSASQFVVTGPALPFILHPGQGASFQVVFRPTSIGTFSGTVSVQFNRYSRGAKTIPVSGTGVAAAQSSPQSILSPSSSALNLGSVLVGSNASQSLALTNTGSASVTISQVAITGSGFTVGGFSVPLTLAAGQSISLPVAFSPAAAGSVTGSVSVVSNASNSPAIVTLTASGVAQTRLLSQSASTLSFGNILVGSSSGTQTISLTNTGNSSLTISQVSVAGTAFTANAFALPLTLAAGQSVSLSAAFAPAAPGNVSGSISIVSNATNSPSTILLSGAGVAQTPQLTPSANTLSFGNILVGSSSASQTLSFTNTGNASVTISQFTTAGIGFTASALTTPVTLASGQTTSVGVAFSPSLNGTSSGSVTLVSNATNSPTTVALSGTGIQPQISVLPSSVAFGSVTVGASNTQSMTIQNTGTANLSLTQAALSGQGFALTGLALPLTVVPGSSATFILSFTPTTAANFTASLSLVSNAPGSPLSVPLSGTGLAQSLQLSVSPGALSFGSMTVGTSSSQPITISNAGNSAVTVSQIGVTGTAYSATGLSLPVGLSAGQTTSFSVVFAPMSAGSLPGTISVVSNATNSPAMVTLSGTGTQQAPSAVNLAWSDSSSGIAGFNVYRGTVSGGPYAKLNSALVPSAGYSDSSVQSATTYYYVTTAVDSTGMESSYSNEASAPIP